jgi:hypothetical protein
MQVRNCIQCVHENGHAFEELIDSLRYGLGDGSLFNSASSCCNEGLEWRKVVLCGIDCVT